MTTKHILAGAVALALASGPALAHAQGNPLADSMKRSHDQVKGFLLKAAEQMAEADYAFKPTPEVRSFGQLLAHVADGNYMICGAAAGAKMPADTEKTKTTKADLAKALADSFAYCDTVWAATGDAKGMETIAFFGNQMPRITALAFNTSHNFEHYGNVVTYMRLKGKVPPSSQRGGMD